MSYQISERKACNTMDFTRSVIRHKSIKDPLESLRMRLRELAMVRVGMGTNVFTFCFCVKGGE